MRMEDNHRHISDEDLAAYLDGNVGSDEVARILAAIAGDNETAEVMAVVSQTDSDMERYTCRVIPMQALAAANPDNLCSFDCETYILRELGFDVDHWSLLETAKANNWLRECGTPLHHVGRLLELRGLDVRRRYDATPGDIVAALDRGDRVIAIVDRDALAGDNQSRRQVVACAPSYHAICVTEIDAAGEVHYLDAATRSEGLATHDAFMRAWRCSGHYMVAAALTPAGYNPQPINVDEIDLDADLEDLTEAIAENAHDIWARARMDEGWTYGPVRDDELRRHPDLVPYSRLPESEKQYDRIMAMNTLRLVRRLGYNIVGRREK